MSSVVKTTPIKELTDPWAKLKVVMKDALGSVLVSWNWEEAAMIVK